MCCFWVFLPYRMPLLLMVPIVIVVSLLSCKGADNIYVETNIKHQCAYPKSPQNLRLWLCTTITQVCFQKCTQQYMWNPPYQLKVHTMPKIAIEPKTITMYQNYTFGSIKCITIYMQIKMWCWWWWWWLWGRHPTNSYRSCLKNKKVSKEERTTCQRFRLKTNTWSNKQVINVERWRSYKC